MRQYPKLPKSYKDRFPFRLGTTSFIYPAGYYENARRLAPFLDEIELILFESRALPEPLEIRRLASLASGYGLKYNVHLPLDVFLGSADSGERRRSVQVLLEIFDLAAPLEPTSWTLHVNSGHTGFSSTGLKDWQGRAAESIRQLQKSGICAERLAIENLDDPVAWMEAVREAVDLNVCMDIGHLIVSGNDPISFFDRHRDRIIMIHLHGVAAGRDHQSLDRLPSEELARVAAILKGYQGSVSVEVFGFEALSSSLDILDKICP